VALVNEFKTYANALDYIDPRLDWTPQDWDAAALVGARQWALDGKPRRSKTN
jgi:hypothetical protein